LHPLFSICSGQFPPPPGKTPVFLRLITELHRRGMKFILDIVCNHSSPDTTDGKGRLYDDGQLVADFHNDQQSWYHHYGRLFKNTSMNSSAGWRRGKSGSMTLSAIGCLSVRHRKPTKFSVIGTRTASKWCFLPKRDSAWEFSK
jgi:hypothetical protein